MAAGNEQSQKSRPPKTSWLLPVSHPKPTVHFTAEDRRLSVLRPSEGPVLLRFLDMLNGQPREQGRQWYCVYRAAIRKEEVTHTS